MAEAANQLKKSQSEEDPLVNSNFYALTATPLLEDTTAKVRLDCLNAFLIILSEL